MAQWFAIAKEIKDSVNNKIGGIPQKIVSTVFFLVTFVLDYSDVS